MNIHIPAQRTVPEEVAANAAAAPEAVELGWGRVLRISAARASLALIASLILWSVLPLMVGFTPRVILSGSMEPRIHVGDIIVTRTVPAATLNKGQVITVADPDHPGRTRTHRLLSREANGVLVTKGDANREADSSKVSVDDVLGLGVIRVPFVGRPAYWLAERNWLALGATTLFLGWCIVTAFPARRSAVTPNDQDGGDQDGGDQDGDDQDRPTAGSDSTRPTRTSRSRRVAVTAAVAAVAAVAVGAVSGPAEAAFKLSVGNPVSTLRAATSFYPYKAEVLGDSPYLYWRLDEASGTTIADSSSGTARTGTLFSGGHTFGVTGALDETPNRAIDFSLAAVTANSATSGPGTFSVEAWVKTTSGNGGRILGFGNGSGQNASSTVDRQLYVAPNGRAYFGIGSAKTTLNSTKAINDGQWHQVVGTHTTGNSGMKLYVDGVLQGSSKATTVLTTGYWRAGAEGMSGWAGNPGQFLDGSLDELAVYTDVLTPAEVSSHFTIATN